MAGRSGSDSTDGHVENRRRPDARQSSRGVAGCATLRSTLGLDDSDRSRRHYAARATATADHHAGAQAVHLPNRGQTAQQEQFDRGQCCSWAVQQSGFDPANPQVMPPRRRPPGRSAGAALFQGRRRRCARRRRGAIGGNAGEGPRSGRPIGGLFGMMRRAGGLEQQQRQQANYAQQQQWALNRGHANYNRAFSACMASRGYTVS